MRRKDKLQDTQKAIEIMQKAPYCVPSASPASVCDFEPHQRAYSEYQIFSIPMSFVYHESHIYIHTAKAGRKISFFNNGSRACFVFVEQVQVPNLYKNEDLEQIAIDDPKRLGSHVFTTGYESTIAYGTISPLEDRESQDRAMALLCQKYMPDKMAFVQTSVNFEQKHLNVYAIKLDQISAKTKYFENL